MDLALTVLFQVIIMLLLIGVGIIALKCKLVTEEGKKQLSNLLLYIVIPAVILNSYRSKFDASLVSGLLWSFLLAIVSHLIAIAVAYLFFHKKGDSRSALTRFCCIYSNCAFMAIPLIHSLLGDIGVFYASAYITIFNLFSWTQGIIMLTGKTTLKDIGKALLSPTVISVVVGLAVFFLRIPIPDVIGKPIEYLAALNTPLSMIVIGVSIGQANILSCFTSLKLYAITFVRNLLIPGLVLIILLFLPFDKNILLCILIEIACPTAASSVMFATKYQLDAEYASKVVALTTILSIITIPLMVFLFQLGQG